MKRFLRTAAVLVAAALLTPMPAPAKPHQQQDPNKQKEKKPRLFAKVTSVNATKNMVTIADTDGSKKEYTVTAFTTITVDGKPSRLTDVQEGMKADFVADSTGTKLTRLEVSQPPDEKPDKKKH